MQATYDLRRVEICCDDDFSIIAGIPVHYSHVGRKVKIKDGVERKGDLC
jgi:hypothetical protein